jgi:hypothetical protein
MTEHQRALLISFSDLTSDPRVRKQIDWLTDSGWTVDTLGLGDHPTPQVRDHFALRDQARWVRSRLGSAFIYLLLPRMRRFALLTGNRIPAEAGRRVRDGEYSLILFNDFELIAWTRNRKVFTLAARRARIHLDLHEYREPRLALDSAWRIITNDYYRWTRSLIGDPVFTSRSTVARGLAESFAEDFGVPEPAVVRNCPPFVDQSPSPVDPEDIRIVFHGMASWARGLKQMCEALRAIDKRFSVTFMLTANRNVIAELAEYSHDLGDRVRFVPPVPMRDVGKELNHYDLEIMFYQPDSPNLVFSLPNKFFEAIQGRLGLVIGESPMMAEIVREYGNGVIVDGWSSQDLARTLSGLTAERITELKSASHTAAIAINAETERAAFLASIGASE